MNPQRKYTLREAGVRLRHGELVNAKGFHRTTVRRWIDAGHLDCIRFDGNLWITEAQIRDFERRMANGEPSSLRRGRIANLKEE